MKLHLFSVGSEEIRWASLRPHQRGNDTSLPLGPKKREGGYLSLTDRFEVDVKFRFGKETLVLGLRHGAQRKASLREILRGPLLS